MSLKMILKIINKKHIKKDKIVREDKFNNKF